MAKKVGLGGGGGVLLEVADHALLVAGAAVTLCGICGLQDQDGAR